MNHPVVKLEILWNSTAAKEGFFFTGRRKRQKTNYICSLHATAVGLKVEVGWVARGHGNKCSGAKRGHFHVVAVYVPERYL